MSKVFANRIQHVKPNQPVGGMTVSDVLLDILDDVGRHPMMVDTRKSREVIDNILVVILKLIQTKFKKLSELIHVIGNGGRRSRQALHLSRWTPVR